METKIKELMDILPGWEEEMDKVKEILLTNLIMLSEIPAPTFNEQRRAEFLVNRFTEYNLQNISIDEVGNALGMVPGTVGEKNILVVAHMDSLFPESVDHTVTVQPGKVSGVGVSDNGLGIAALASIPYILQHLGLELESNLILMGASRSLGMGDLEGLRFFLNNFKRPITAGVSVEGVKLGRLSNYSIGMLRGKLTYQTPEEYDWTKFNSTGAIVNMNEMISRILEIPLPLKPKTSIILGSIEGGTSYNTVAAKATLRMEIRSESDEMVKKLDERITSLAEETMSRTGALVEFREISRRRPGGTEFSHPLNQVARNILKTLGIDPRLSPSTSEVSAFIQDNIPAITIGLSDGENLGEENEMIQIEPIKKGLAQLMGLLSAIDKGYCNER